MNYESTFIVSPELPTDRVEELTAKVVKTIEAAKGTIKTVQQLGKKKLAYPINKFREGSYVYMELSGEGSMVASLESFFKFNDSVIRFLTVQVEKKKVLAKPTANPEQSAENPMMEVKNDATK
ncbi:MAG: 30S ribosomal protein S6 [Endomicrobium sp.]|jgi:small subunit ribosomal protein S6|nr:30S ribosomal protein S6 [Endomicrobium sp.]